MKHLKIALAAAGMIVGMGSAHAANKSLGIDPNTVGGVQLPCETKVAHAKVDGVLKKGTHSSATSRSASVQSRSGSIAQ